jgi:hypothetical protein
MRSRRAVIRVVYYVGRRVVKVWLEELIEKEELMVT